MFYTVHSYMFYLFFFAKFETICYFKTFNFDKRLAAVLPYTSMRIKYVNVQIRSKFLRVFLAVILLLFYFKMLANFTRLLYM